MFKKHAVQLTFVKPDKAVEPAPEDSHILHPETVKLIAERSKEVVKCVALVAVGVYAAVKAIDTMSQIAVKKTKSADQD